MFSWPWHRKQARHEAAIEAQRLLSKASVDDVKNAASRFQVVLDQMRQTNEERRNERPD
ncbi:hypothetical protein [Oceaniglobus trochenteri]|uniref:hypothetical protein n=1 Tax=Oceaniglobus trochenteri TaxID=2763260 RepID=UPI001CFF776E|nr:hypothetical protein [Oceaniglobus trochenteri]